MICETEKVSSLTFAGTQSNNMSDGGAKEQQQGGFYCFCQPTPFKPNSNLLNPHQTKFKPSLEPQSNNLKPHQTPKLFPNLIVIPNIFCNFAHGITIQ